MKNYLVSFFVLVIIFLLGYHFWPAVNFDNIKYVKIAGQNVQIDFARTAEEREIGLSGRNELKKNEGMLFVFEESGKYPFWMKDMNFSIDIIWLDKDLKVVYIKKNAAPESYPESFAPKDLALYVLEVPADFAEKNNLKEGDSAIFTY